MPNRSIVIGVGGTAAVAIAIGATALASSHHGYGGGASSSRSTVASGTVQTVTARVGGKAETILTDAQGMPLYYYAPDTATTSRVSGGLLAAWPAVTSTTTPTATGLTGNLAVVHDSHGSQLAYNGHLLYTFVSDKRGVVTGQGVQNFFVATPTLSPLNGSSSSSSTGSQTNSYRGY